MKENEIKLLNDVIERLEGRKRRGSKLTDYIIAFNQGLFTAKSVVKSMLPKEEPTQEIKAGYEQEKFTKQDMIDYSNWYIENQYQFADGELPHA